MTPKKPLKDLPAWWWAGLPLAMLVLTLIAFLTSPDMMQLLIAKDTTANGGGIAEHGTVLVLLPGIVAGFVVLRHYRKRLPLWLAGWVLAWTLACIYFAGEEASWGQHYFHWGTPDALLGLNDQNETNLHNIGSWLDQKPRTLVELWVVVAGLMLPLWWRLRKSTPFGASGWRDWFWPSSVGILTAAAFLATFVLGVAARKTGLPTLHALGSNELREFYIAVFLSTYLLSIWYRLRQRT
jgi:hypothetical protein